MVSPAATLTRPFTIQLCGIRGFRLDMFSVQGGGSGYLFMLRSFVWSLACQPASIEELQEA